MPSSINITVFGDASSGQIAVWVCGVALIILFCRIIGKTKGSNDLRFISYCVLAGILTILAFAFFSSWQQPTGKRPVPTAKELRKGDENPRNLPDKSHQEAKPPPLQSPHAGSGVADQT